MNKSCDILIIGGGIAGLRAALTASNFGSVYLLTKGKIGETATERAQGGIAAAIDKIQDSTQYHFEDTIDAGAGLCNEKAVRILVNEGVERVKELIEMGAQFDRAETEGGFALALEGAHKRRRILHAGDATGAEIAKTLGYQILKEGRVKVSPHSMGLDLIVKDGRCAGVSALDLRTNKILNFSAKAVIIASGGICQTYLYTTNPEFATGDGVAMAYRAGCEVIDMEFIQFHPTALVQFKEFEDIIALPQFLISEAVRGEGGILVNNKNERFMDKYHKQMELAPRDIVARAIIEEMNKTNTQCVYLSLKSIGPQKIRRRFPIIYKTCLERGLDITRDLIPVAPAAHYFMGGIQTDVDSCTNIAGLFAAGESASLGVHGANRLASNSLLDGLVFGHRAALSAKAGLDRKLIISSPEVNSDSPKFKDEELQRFKLIIKSVMWNEVGIVRSGESLANALKKIRDVRKRMEIKTQNAQETEIKNMAQVAELVARAAFDRKESRGAHYRSDFAGTDDKNWKRHLTYKI